MPTPAAWLVQTDNALYHSKHTGRNRVTLAGAHEVTQDPHLAAAVVPQWLIKSAYEALATPLTYLVVNTLKRIEGTDPFDTQVDFNPLRISE